MKFAILLLVPKPEHISKTTACLLMVFRLDFQQNFQ